MNRKEYYFFRPFAIAVAMFVALCTHAQQKVEVQNYCTKVHQGNIWYRETVVPDENGTFDFDFESLGIIRYPAFVGVEWPKCSGAHDHVVSVRTLNMINGVAHYGPTYSTTVHYPADETETQTAQQKMEIYDYCPKTEHVSYSVREAVFDEEGNTDIEIQSLVSDPSSTSFFLYPDSLYCSGGHDHLIRVRAKSAANYGPTYSTTVYMAPVGMDSLTISSAEYFWDEDPGFGQATPIDLPEGKGELTDDALMPDTLTEGDHLFGLRLRSNVGWGPTLICTVTVPERGDTDDDGEITMEDVTALLSILLGNDNVEPHQYDHVTADVNRDRRISIADMTKLVNMILEQQSQ